MKPFALTQVVVVGLVGLFAGTPSFSESASENAPDIGDIVPVDARRNFSERVSGNVPAAETLEDLTDACATAARGTDLRPCDLLIAQIELAPSVARDQTLHADALSNRALIFGRAGDREAAFADLAAALILQPDRAALLVNRAYLYLLQGSPRAALNDLDQVLGQPNLDPRLVRAARYNRSFALRGLGDSAGAAAELAAATAQLP